MQYNNKRLGQLAVSSLLAAMLAACGGGGSSGGSGSQDSGQVAMGITDAEGDFLSYSVDVTSIRLVKANGTTVEVVPNSTRIDFAQYTDVTEFFSIATVPAGEYVSATMVLDYSNADIFVEDALGGAVEAAPVDINGEPVTTLQVTIDLADGEPLEVLPGAQANMVIDFDLAASNEVTSWAPVEVTVDSVLVADIQWDGSRELRARGLLDAVDVAAQTFTLELLPFNHGRGDFGDAMVNVSDATIYHIDGVEYLGDDGLAALAALGVDAPVVVLGDVASSDDVRSYTAEYVYAGTSVAWAGRDAIKGSVLARSGDTLIVRGIAFDGDNGYEYFRDDIVVNLAPDTAVTRQIPSLSALSIDDISVGSRIELVGDLFSAGDATVIDTTAGHVHLLVSEVAGTVQDVAPPALAIDVARINRRDVSLYNFAGTGIDATSDAAPSNYDVDTQTLLLDGIDLGEWVMLRGFPTAFGTAPADFVAYSVTDVAMLPESAHLILTWPHGSSTAIVSLSDSDMVVDSTGANEVFKVCGKHREDDHRGRGHHRPGNGHGNPHDDDDDDNDDDNDDGDSVQQGALYTIVPTDNGVYSIKRRGGHNVKLYGDFATFSQTLAAELDAGAVVRQVHVKGAYDTETGVVSADSINVVIK